MCEPLRGWCHVHVSARRTRKDYARCVRDLVDGHYPGAEEDSVGAGQPEHADGASLYEAFPPAEACRLLDKIEFHDTPKHGSWVNMAGTEINIMNGHAWIGARQPGGDRGRSRRLGEQTERSAGTDPLDLHPRGGTAEAAETLPVK